MCVSIISFILLCLHGLSILGSSFKKGSGYGTIHQSSYFKTYSTTNNTNWKAGGLEGRVSK